MNFNTSDLNSKNSGNSDLTNQNSHNDQTKMIETAIDPVCQMTVIVNNKAIFHKHNEIFYYFCNINCKNKFIAQPNLYINKNKQATPTTNDSLSYFLSPESFEYICPMDPEVKQSKPGSCSKCGMALETTLQTENKKNIDIELKDLNKRFFIALPCTIFLWLFCVNSVQNFILNTHIIHTHSSNWILFECIASSIVMLYSGIPIYKRAWAALRSRYLNMFSLISLGSIISYTLSLYSFLSEFLVRSNNLNLEKQQPTSFNFFESAASIITLVILGQIIELKTKSNSTNTIDQIILLLPKYARKYIEDNQAKIIALNEINENDILQVLPGERIPVDGCITKGQSTINESLITGIDIPIIKEKDAKVYAGTINIDQELLVKAQSIGKNTVLANIIQTIISAQQSRPSLQELCDKISAYFIPAVFSFALFTYFFWLIYLSPDNLNLAILNSLTVLIIACPCTLGLATPLAISLAINKAAEVGIIIKDAKSLEELSKLDTIFFDKTGTLTEGKLKVQKIISLNPNYDESEILSIASALENHSQHPIAEAIKKKSTEIEKFPPKIAESVIQHLGLGIEGQILEHNAVLGNLSFLRKLDIFVPNTILNSIENENHTTIYLCINKILIAYIVLSDQLREEATEALNTLRKLNLSTLILTGDTKSSTKKIFEILGINENNLKADLCPLDKVNYIRECQNAGQKVAMVGDGLNDSAALSVANIGISLSSGTDLSKSVASIYILKNDLTKIATAIKLARATSNIIKENLFFAFVYNIVALIAASGIAYKATGILLSPSLAALAMILSSISVILNSLRLKNFNT